MPGFPDTPTGGGGGGEGGGWEPGPGQRGGDVRPHRGAGPGGSAAQPAPHLPRRLGSGEYMAKRL